VFPVAAALDQGTPQRREKHRDGLWPQPDLFVRVVALVVLHWGAFDDEGEDEA